MIDEYLSRSHCYVLANVVLSLAEDSCIPDDVRLKARELVGLCDEYVADGFSFRVSEEPNGDTDRIYSPPIEALHT